jgi:tRNA 2-selenouridine synthase
MASNTFPLDTLVHPHAMEVQEFSWYALIVDLRPHAAFAVDHLPGAVSLPATEIAWEDPAAICEALSLERRAQYRRSAQQSLNIGSLALPATASRIEPGARVLAYGDGGGHESTIFAIALRQAGYWVDVLPGGWPAYCRWVAWALEVLPRLMTFRIIGSSDEDSADQHGVMKQKPHGQVLDLTALASNVLAGRPVPHDAAQQAFDSAVLHALRCFTHKRLVWVNELQYPHPGEIGALTLPPALNDQLRRLDIEPAASARQHQPRRSGISPYNSA